MQHLLSSSHPSQKLSCVREAHFSICSSSILFFGPIRTFSVSVIQPQWLASLLFVHSELLVSDSILSLLSEETNSRVDFSALFTLPKAKVMKVFCSKIPLLCCIRYTWAPSSCFQKHHGKNRLLEHFVKGEE